MKQADSRLKCSAPWKLVSAHVLDLALVAVAAAAAAVVFVSEQLGMTGVVPAVGFLNLVFEFPMAASWLPQAKVALPICGRVFVGEKLCWAGGVPHSYLTGVLPDLDGWAVTTGVRLS
jgi:hypothetical protein